MQQYASMRSSSRFVAPQPEAIATVLPVIPELPLQQLPEPVHEEPVIAALPAPEPMPEIIVPGPEPIFMPPAFSAVQPEQLSQPVREELVGRGTPCTRTDAGDCCNGSRIDCHAAVASSDAPVV
jgi:hypothetical protein